MEILDYTFNSLERHILWNDNFEENGSIYWNRWNLAYARAPYQISKKQRRERITRWDGQCLPITSRTFASLYKWFSKLYDKVLILQIVDWWVNMAVVGNLWHFYLQISNHPSLACNRGQQPSRPLLSSNSRPPATPAAALTRASTTDLPANLDRLAEAPAGRDRW